jgi:hypothetical protein
MELEGFYWHPKYIYVMWIIAQMIVLENTQNSPNFEGKTLKFAKFRNDLW